MKNYIIGIILVSILFGLIGCSSNEDFEEPSNEQLSKDTSTETISFVTWQEFKDDWEKEMPVDELKNMEEMDLDEGIKVPNLKRYNMRISEYLFLAVDVDETTDEVLYLYMLGKYHEKIFENQVEGFKTMIKLMNPKMVDESVNQLLYDLGFDPELTNYPESESTSIELNGFEYVATFDNQGIVQLEMTPLNNKNE